MSIDVTGINNLICVSKFRKLPHLLQFVLKLFYAGIKIHVHTTEMEPRPVCQQ